MDVPAKESSLRLVMSAHGRGELWLDGHLVPRVRAVTIRAEAGELNAVTIETTAAVVEVVGPFVQQDETTIADTARRFATGSGYAEPEPRDE